MSLQEVMDPQTDWQWDGQAWIMRPIVLPPRPRPPFPPICPPFPPRPINGPIAGVTDGSAARPGEVGEYVMGTSAVNVVIDPAEHTYLAQPLVLSPGDWDIQASFYAPGLNAEAIAVHLEPLPTGVSGGLDGNIQVSTGSMHARVTTPRTQALVSVPTLLPFSLAVRNATNTSAATLTVTGRRMR